MPLKFTESGDGVQRATMRVEFRVERESIAYALAMSIVGHANPEIALAQFGRAEVEQIVRERYAQSGPPEQWLEYGDGDFDWIRAYNAATERVADLFGAAPAVVP